MAMYTKHDKKLLGKAITEGDYGNQLKGPYLCSLNNKNTVNQSSANFAVL